MGFALTDMQLTSTAFTSGAPIPRQHTGEGEDISPALAWSEPPAQTASFAIVCHDPDAPVIFPHPQGNYGFVHWVLYNIPGAVRTLPEATCDYTAGANDFGKTGYAGPMPPPGHGRHHYFFCLLALRCAPELEVGLSMWALLKQVEPELLGMNRLMGVYQRHH